jgi:U3 small nucleolar RNA-associated protein 15
MEQVFGKGHIKPRAQDLPPVIGPSDEYKVERKRVEKLREFDRYLKGFKYSAALDAGLAKVSCALPASLSQAD